MTPLPATSRPHRACRSRWPRAAARCFSCPGRWPRTPPPGEPADGDAARQAGQIPRTIAAALAATGKDLDDAIRAGLYPTDMPQSGAINQAYRRHPAAPCPARTATGAAALPLGAAAEMDAVTG